MKREHSLVTGGDNLETLYTFKDFPVFMGCVDAPIEKDVKADMIWDICRDSGLIQLRDLVPLELVYLDQHNDGTGRVWQEHYKAFADFISKYNPKSVLEIGGAHEHIAKHLLDNTDWTIIEPNPQHIADDRIDVIKGFFTDKFSSDKKFDTVIHSHVFEHAYNPFEFIEHIGTFLKPGDKHIFAFPNFLPMLEKKFTNCLNFEHTVFLTEEFTKYILQKAGFKILEVQPFGDPHSIFYATEKIANPSEAKLNNKYEDYKKLFNDFVSYHKDMITELNQKIEESDAPVYLFGGHIFSQFLIQFGLKTDNVVGILDNSPLKQGKRLYGTNLSVESPKILKDVGRANVILKVATYDKEIKDDILKNINNEVVFW
jgi:hypothetical protein